MRVMRRAFGPCSVWRERRETEVHDPHRAVRRDHHVLRFEVAVDDPGAVRGCQAPPRQAEHAQDLVARPPLLFQPDRDRVAFDQLHRDEHAPVGRADVVDGHQVRMGELGDRLRLAHHPRRLDVVGIGVAAHDLDGDLSIQLGIVRGVDLAHSAPSHELEQAVAPHHRPGAVSVDRAEIDDGRRRLGPPAPVRRRCSRRAAGRLPPARPRSAAPPAHSSVVMRRPAAVGTANETRVAQSGTPGGGARPPPASPPRASRSRMQRPFARRDSPSSSAVR